MREYSSNEYYTGTKRGGKDKHCLRQKGQAVNKHCDILDAIHKVPRYIDGSLLHSQNGCQICSTGVDKVPGWTQVHIFKSIVYGKMPYLELYIIILILLHLAQCKDLL